jgi:hypothetical protein
MSDWKERVKAEYNELDERLAKLRAFLADEDKAAEIAGEGQVELLWKQEGAMVDLLQILVERLELAEENEQ